MKLQVYDASTAAGRTDHANAVAAHAMIIGAFRQGLLHDRFCIKEQVKYADVVLVVEAWLEQNTDLLGEDAGALADAALLKAFPCR